MAPAKRRHAKGKKAKAQTTSRYSPTTRVMPPSSFESRTLSIAGRGAPPVEAKWAIGSVGEMKHC
jgi:hypothetical protein